mmetsp:Transcript_296/g.673  ORF Transcript_296/g.673 Transcript_296/m.673 type:complete len:222 (-) Transcript_296:284-949(-)
MLERVVVPGQVGIHAVLLQQGPNPRHERRRAAVLPPREDGVVPAYNEPISLGREQHPLQPLELLPPRPDPLCCPGVPHRQRLTVNVPRLDFLHQSGAAQSLVEQHCVDHDELQHPPPPHLLLGAPEVVGQDPPPVPPALGVEYLRLGVAVVVMVAEQDIPRHLKGGLPKPVLEHALPQRVVLRLHPPPVEVVPEGDHEAGVRRRCSQGHLLRNKVGVGSCG